MTPASGTADQNPGALQREHWDKDQSGRRPASHPAVRALFEPRADFIASLVDSAKDRSVLDVGCGNGFLTVPLQARFGRAVGLDASAAMVAVNPCREKMVASATRLPFDNASFDVVVASHLLHHLDEADCHAAVAEMGRVARNAVVLYEPNRSHPLMLAFGLLKPHEKMLLRFSRGYVSKLLELTNMPERSVRVEGWTTPNLCPAWWAPVASTLDRTPLHHAGLFIRGVARRGAPGPVGNEGSAQ